MGDENQPRGTFLIRPSEHNPNGYSLSVKDWEAHRGYHVKHYKIKPLDNGGFYISTNKTYDSLPELVMAYSSKLNHYKTFCIFNFFFGAENAYGLCHVLSKPCRKPEPTMWDLAPTYRDKWEISRDEIQLLRRSVVFFNFLNYQKDKTLFLGWVVEISERFSTASGRTSTRWL